MHILKLTSTKHSMKGIDIFCASQASTSISMDTYEPSSSSNIHHLGSSPFIDRHNPIISNNARKIITNTPCPFQKPIDPKPLNKNHRKISTKPKDQKNKKKSTVEKRSDLFTPPGSTRYLLGDNTFFNVLSSDNDPVSGLVHVQDNKCQVIKFDDSSSSTTLSSEVSNSPSSRSSDQVVVLRVSLHCRGCEAKVRKHISRMTGVRSFNIDFAGKKVTVMGDVTPVSVLASISKVKHAQLLPNHHP